MTPRDLLDRLMDTLQRARWRARPEWDRQLRQALGLLGVVGDILDENADYSDTADDPAGGGAVLEARPG